MACRWRGKPDLDVQAALRLGAGREGGAVGSGDGGDDGQAESVVVAARTFRISVLSRSGPSISARPLAGVAIAGPRHLHWGSDNTARQFGPVCSQDNSGSS
jgi:hypothetical protein